MYLDGDRIAFTHSSVLVHLPRKRKNVFDWHRSICCIILERCRKTKILGLVFPDFGVCWTQYKSWEGSCFDFVFSWYLYHIHHKDRWTCFNKEDWDGQVKITYSYYCTLRNKSAPSGSKCVNPLTRPEHQNIANILNEISFAFPEHLVNAGVAGQNA